jgi:hypothetical protein
MSIDGESLALIAKHQAEKHLMITFKKLIEEPILLDQDGQQVSATPSI